MQRMVCPFWIGYILLNPFRKLFENPEKMLGPFVREGMVILEPGCGMGYFTLPLARMVGPAGRVIAIDIQEKMISALRKRAKKADLLNRMDLRVIKPGNMDLIDLNGTIDLVIAIHMVHEIPDQNLFFEEMVKVLKPGGKLFMAEPKGHVTRQNFEHSVAVARKSGLHADLSFGPLKERRAIMQK